ncbi:insulinase family protein [Acidobacteria bacterium AH-259-D05]|nr:insulinase family protein [Acidobacteria bacterium AH-259-D05]
MRWPALLLFSSIYVASLEAEPLAIRGVSQAPEYFKAFQSREDKNNMTRVVLRNGLIVVIEEHPMVPLVNVLTYIKAGYSQESAEKAGVSHLLERLYLYRSEVLSQMGDLGAVVNVKTHYEGTSFSSSAAAENVLKILELHAGLLRAPQIDSTGIAQEVQILIAEREDRENSPRVFAREKLLELVYPEEPRGSGLASKGLSALLGTGSTLEKLTQFHDAYYHSGNTILVVSGAVRREIILEKVVELYGSMKPSAPAVQASRAAPFVGKAFRYLHLRGNTPRPYLLFAYRVPGPQHDDGLPLLLLSYLLGQGRGALLQQSMMGKGGSAVDVQVQLETPGPRGAFVFIVNPALDKVDRAEVQVLAQIEALKRRGVPVSQLDRAKALLLKDHYKGLQSLERRADLLAQHEAMGSYSHRDNLPKLLTQITPKQMARVLERYFQDSNLVLLEYFPQNAEPRRFNSETLLETLRLLVSTMVNQEAGPLDVLQITDEGSSFQSPEFTASYLKRDLKYTSILRGPVIYFKEEHSLPLVSLGFFFFGGRINETQETAGITELLLRTLLHSAASRERSVSWLDWERLGADINVVNEPDFFGFQTTVLSPHLEQVFGSLIDWIRLSDFQDEDLEWARQEVLALMAREKESHFIPLLNSAREQVFNGHPYGLSPFGTTESIARVTLDRLESWAESQIKGVHPQIVIRGDVEGTSLLRDFVSKLSDSKYESREPIEKELTETADPSDPQGDTIVEERNGRIVMAFRGPAVGARAQAALDTLQVALLGPSGRLSTSLRNQGLAHQLKMFHRAGFNGGSIFIHFVSVSGKEGAARQELFDQLDQLRNAPLREPEFLNAVVGAITRFHILQQAGEDYLMELAHNLAAGKGVESMERYLSALRTLRREDVMSLAEEFFRIQEKGSNLQDSGSTFHLPGIRVAAAVRAALLPVRGQRSAGQEVSRSGGRPAK